MVWELAPYTEADLQQPDRRPPPGLRGRVRGAARRPARVRRGHQPVHRRGARRPAQDARRVRGDRAARGARGLEGHRHRRHGRGRRLDLRSGGRVGARPRRRCSRRRGRASGPGAGGACGATSARPTTPRRRRPCAGGRSRIRAARAGVRAARRCPDPGTLEAQPGLRGRYRLGRRVAAAGADGAAATGAARGLLAFPGAMSNAIAVSARESASGRPIAVFGPQTGYFAPQALMEHEVQAPGLSARGVALPGRQPVRADRPRARLRLERDDVRAGHRRHVRGRPVRARRRQADARARCTTSTAASACRSRCSSARTRGSRPPPTPTPAGSETLARRAHPARASSPGGRRIKGRPVAYTRLRATYMHEPDAGLAFSYFNNPDRIRGPKDFQRTAGLIGYTFNWFYVDAQHVAYQNSGYNPRRAPGTDPDLPIRGRKRYEWQGYDPDNLHARRVHAAARAPALRRPGVGRRLEQQAGAGLPRIGRQLGLRSDLPGQGAGRPRRAADARQPQDDAGRDGRGDGRRRHRRPARRRRAAVRAARARHARRPGAAQGGRRSCGRGLADGRPPDRPRPGRNLRARERDPDLRRLVAALDEGAVRAGAGQRGCSRRSST